MAITEKCGFVAEGDNKKEREQELKMMMKRLEAKYAALQIVPVISKLGTSKVCCITRNSKIWLEIEILVHQKD